MPGAAAPATFSTARLVAERIGPQHLDAVAAMYADPVVMATLGGTRTREETEAMLARYVAHWEEHGFGHYALFESGRFAGRAALHHMDIGGADEIEVGFGFRAECWGRGLATEIARELVRIGFETLGLRRLVSATLTTNRASQRVMRKAGFAYERDVEYVGLPHVLYSQRR